MKTVHTCNSNDWNRFEWDTESEFVPFWSFSSCLELNIWSYFKYFLQQQVFVQATPTLFTLWRTDSFSCSVLILKKWIHLNICFCEVTYLARVMTCRHGNHENIFNLSCLACDLTESLTNPDDWSEMCWFYCGIYTTFTFVSFVMAVGFHTCVVIMS